MSNQDPWAHRSAGMKCVTCMWFVEKAPGPIGRCRRHAPSMNGYPVVYRTDWCGDHKLDETKLTSTDQVTTGAMNPDRGSLISPGAEKRNLLGGGTIQNAPEWPRREGDA